ncbi:MAG: hypothetical protein RLZZ385_1134 [Pseudomonadota bacterium]|jgi:uncharacterized protein YaeQ
MALKPTIYKAQIALADMNRDVYESLTLTVARHPSETAERMLVRVLAYCLDYREGLSFGRGLSTAEDPDLWAHSLHGSVDLWIEVGEPLVERIKKATRQAAAVKVVSFNSKAGVWWSQNQAALAALPVDVLQLDWLQVQQFATQLERTMDLTISISGESLYINSPKGDCEVSWQVLQSADQGSSSSSGQ